MHTLNLALGAMAFGTRLAAEDAFPLLDRFVEAGGTMIDTADCYAFWDAPDGRGGQSEEVIGRWLARRGGMRDRILLSTKCGAEPGGPGEWPANREGLSAAAIERAAERSLKRLGTDRVDLYWAHMEDRATPLEETAEGFGRLAANGVAVRLGCSNHPVWRVERARAHAAAAGLPGFTALQLRDSYVRPRPDARVPSQGHRFGWVTDEVADYVHSDPDLTLWVYTALLNGAYTRPDRPLPEAYDHPGTTRRLAVLAEVAAELGVSRNQVVLAWLAGGERAATPIVGVSDLAQLEEAIAGVSLDLPTELRERLDAAA